MNDTPIIAIVGETASGKSRLAMELAVMFDGEIIAADSMTVYKHFNIGSAKPSKSERAKVKHHLIDVADPSSGFNVAGYKLLANNAISEIIGRKKIPILAGGSGLYVNSVLFDFGFRSAVDQKQREELNSLDNNQLIFRAKTLNISTEGIDISNNRRLIRLIESNGEISTSKPIRPNTIVIGKKIGREQLNNNIAERVDEMFASGLSEEVLSLSNTYGWDIEPMRSIGYREFKNYFDGKVTLEETRQEIILNTKHLAKKQRTWFKRNNSIQWVDEQLEAVDLVTTFLNNYRR